MSFPRHIAIIMDGNGRYAKKLDLADRTKGHEEGANTVRTITTHCVKIGIEVLTLYAFSTENWDRPKSEVNFLMKMLDRYLKNELKTLTDNNIRFFAIGDLAKLPKHLQDRISKTIEATADNSAMTQVLALNYGAKDEIIRAANKIRSNEITKEALNDALDTASFPDVDMLIRTGGEQRLSNFLLWQCAYTELFFTPTLWPEFNAIELDRTIEDFQKRERRFGGV
ncbi:MAG: di-trans,poly-cis-decaprenylcistransferase [Helicobacteraceae bacterium]|jgi:undecaprenyl diphosphate synthase|nr:di-trans,poly-cis-decaprenylcistransferase [Helicobacteraceae bacterium]